MIKMIVTAWKNGRHNKTGAGYGFRLKIPDRNTVFKNDWESILLTLDDATEPFEVKITPSFWRRCCELRSKEIGLWLIWLMKKGLVNWPKGNPPKFSMETISEKHFTVSPL